MLHRIPTALALLLCLAGCSSVVTNLNQQTPAQVTTLADAEQAARFVTKAAKVYVDTGTHSADELAAIRQRSGAVHGALTDLNAARAKGQSLAFAAFNAALTAFRKYEAATAAPATVSAPAK